MAKALERARERHCTSLQVFTTAPVQWAFRELSVQEATAFRQDARRADIRPVFVHGQYLLNLASRERWLFQRSVRSLAEDLERAQLLGAQGVVIHLGSPGRAAEKRDLDRVVRGVDRALGRAGPKARILLENSAGQGNAIGGRLGDLAYVLEHSARPDQLAVCFDTAHAFAAGYDVADEAGLEATLAELDRAVGLERVELVHCNDSRAPLGSGVDRHWHIGKGKIGREGFRRIINHPALHDRPFIMETPEAALKTDLMNYRAFMRLVEE